MSPIIQMPNRGALPLEKRQELRERLLEFADSLAQGDRMDREVLAYSARRLALLISKEIKREGAEL